MGSTTLGSTLRSRAADAPRTARRTMSTASTDPVPIRLNRTGPRTWRAAGLLLAAVVSGCVSAETPADTSPVPPEPEVFAPGVISDDREQYRIAFTPSGDTAYFGAADGFFPQTRDATIYRSIRIGGQWQSPEVAAFSGRNADIDPFITPDGRHLYFSSIRPAEDAGEDAPEGGAGDADGPDGPARVADLWRVSREEGGWGSPERLAISTLGDDLYPSLDADGNLYFANAVPRGEGPDHWRIVVARAAPDGWTDPEPVPGGVNSEDAWAFNPAVSPDGRQMVFTRLNPLEARATGFGELYRSRLDDTGAWTDAVNLGSPVNTGMDEYHPSLSPDGSTLYFVRRDPFSENASGSLYRVDARVLERAASGGG
ncbi:MAG: hypothetical protein EA350_08415 [Gemmatimonadales bacterium]|nr:MAG: hypothetical protein EA350_08415 [Gemmatimonadales bacterium]